MSILEQYAELKASVEEQYLPDFKAEQPYDMYFELGAILAARVVIIDRSVDMGGLDADLLDLAERSARDSVRYSIGYYAYAADASKNNKIELEKLVRQVGRDAPNKGILAT